MKRFKYSIAAELIKYHICINSKKLTNYENPVFMDFCLSFFRSCNIWLLAQVKIRETIKKRTRKWSQARFFISWIKVWDDAIRLLYSLLEAKPAGINQAECEQYIC